MALTSIHSYGCLCIFESTHTELIIMHDGSSIRYALLSFCLIFVSCEDPSSTTPTDMPMDLAGTMMSDDDQRPEAGTSTQCISSGEEICDTVDNDCDGQIDEAFPSLGMACEFVIMSCRSEGVFACTEQGEATCNAIEISIETEQCDATDNDCDGQVDEGFNFLVDSENCGACGVACTWPHATGVCEMGTCQLTACQPGFEDRNNDLSDGCECNQGAEELCDGIDNDCDGQIDESYAIGEGCRIGDGQCESYGVFVCDNERSARCDASPRSPNPEVCDGLDNDCDGQSDEDFDMDEDGSPSCPDCMSCGQNCPEICNYQDCDDEDASIFPTQLDVCADGVDQNCDGHDAPCSLAYSRAQQIHMLNTEEAQARCPDVTGDGIGDNAFAIISGIVNPSIVEYIRTNEMNILLSAQGFDQSRPELRFNFSVLLSRYLRPPPRYLIRANNFDDNGNPKMLFPYSRFDTDISGRVSGGPGSFEFSVPFMGTDVIVPITNAYIEGRFTSGTSSDRFNLSDGLVSGVIDKRALQDSLVLLDPPIVQVINTLLNADVDTDGDGEGDRYSICMRVLLNEVDTELEVIDSPISGGTD